MNPNTRIRNLAIELLDDDDDGINTEAWHLLESLLHETGNQDICDAVEAQDGRWLLEEDDANRLR